MSAPTKHLPKRALISITSASAPMFDGGGEITGMFISEALHPFQVFRAAGFQVDLASETGKYTADWLSLQPDFLPPADKAVYEDHESEFRRKLDHLPKAADLHAADYGIFFASAGHASLIDYPSATHLQALASGVWAAGGVVSAVCHGGAMFGGIVDADTGKSIVAGRNVTGFTTRGEEELHVLDTIKKWDRPTIEATAASLGAHYVSPEGPWDDFTQVDGRVVSGANPQSAKSTAEAAVKVYNEIVEGKAV